MKKKSKNIVHKKRISKRRHLNAAKDRISRFINPVDKTGLSQDVVIDRQSIPQNYLQPIKPPSCGHPPPSCMADSWIENVNLFKNKITGEENIKIYRCMHKDGPGGHFCASDGRSGYWNEIHIFYQIDKSE